MVVGNHFSFFVEEKQAFVGGHPQAVVTGRRSYLIYLGISEQSGGIGRIICPNPVRFFVKNERFGRVPEPNYVFFLIN